MKRDLDLIREILLSVEEFEPERIGQIQTISVDQFSGTEPQNLHHMNMLVEANLLRMVGKPTLGGSFGVSGMSMAGHDFLDAIRDDTIWDKTKDRLSKAGGWTLDIALAVAQEEVKRRLGLGLQDL